MIRMVGEVNDTENIFRIQKNTIVFNKFCI